MPRTARARDRVAFALAVALAICTAAVHAAPIGEPAPAFALPAVDGSTLDSASLRGKVVLVDFWASWCGPCRQSFPFFDELQSRHAAEGLVVIGVNLDEERGDADRFLAERPVSFTIVFDPAATVPPTFGLKAMPSSYLIGRDGIVRAAHAGFRTGDADRIEEEVRALLAGKAP